MEVLFLTTKNKAGRNGIEINGQLTIRMSAAEDPLQPFERSSNRRAGTDHPRGCRSARARQVIIDLASCVRHLFRDQARQWPGVACRRVGDYREWRLHRVSEVPRLGSGPRHQFLVMREQRIELVYERLDLGGIAAREAPRLAFPDSGQRGTHASERRQADPDLQQRGGKQADSDNDQGDRQHPRECADRLVHTTHVSGNDEPETFRPRPLHADHPLEHQQSGATRPTHRMHMQFSIGRGVDRDCQHAVPQGSRAQDALPCGGTSRIDLPVEPGIRSREARVAQRQGESP